MNTTTNNPEIKPRVLLVDDEPNVLAGLRRSLARRFDVTTAEGGVAALELLAKPGGGAFQVVVTDMRMPQVDGIEFVRRARAAGHRESVYLMLTGNADQDTAVRAINEGQVFRFLNKPCSADQLEAAVLAAIRQHELVTAERVLLRDTVSGSLRLLSEVLELSHPPMALLQRTIRRVVKELCDELGIEAAWHIDLAASLCMLGFALTGTNQPVDEIGDGDFEASAESGSRLLRHVPRLEPVAAVIRRQREPGPMPTTIDMGDAVCRETVGARLLRFAIDLERHLAATPEVHAVIRRMRGDVHAGYDTRLLDAVERLPSLRERRAQSAEWTLVTMQPRLLEPGMILKDDVLSSDQKLLLSKGHELTTAAIERLRTMAARGVLNHDVNVLVRADPGPHST